MSPEKVAILVVAGLIAVLLAVALLGTEPNGNPIAPSAEKASAVPEKSKPVMKQIEQYTYEDIVRGAARPRPQEAPVHAPPADGKPSAETVEYVIRKDDTIEKIARRELGNRDLVGRILALNKGLNPSRLKIGQKILLPVVQRETRAVTAEASKPGEAKRAPAKARTPARTSPARPRFAPVASARTTRS